MAVQLKTTTPHHPKSFFRKLPFFGVEPDYSEEIQAERNGRTNAAPGSPSGRCKPGVSSIVLSFGFHCSSEVLPNAMEELRKNFGSRMVKQANNGAL